VIVPSVSAPATVVCVTVTTQPPLQTGLALAIVYGVKLMFAVVTKRFVTAAVVAAVLV